MDQMVRMYRPEARWLILVTASRLGAGDPLRESVFDAILRGDGADVVSLREARRRESMPWLAIVS